MDAQSESYNPPKVLFTSDKKLGAKKKKVRCSVCLCAFLPLCFKKYVQVSLH